MDHSKQFHMWKDKVKVTQLCPTLWGTMDYTVLGILQARIMEYLSLLQGIFPTQKSNQGLLHCRWILDQLSYQEKDSKIRSQTLNFLVPWSSHEEQWHWRKGHTPSQSVFCPPSPPRCTVVVVPNTLLYLLHKRAALTLLLDSIFSWFCA